MLKGKSTEEFQFLLSADIDFNVQLKIINLEGNFRTDFGLEEFSVEDSKNNFVNSFTHLYVTCCIFANDYPLTSLARTSFSEYRQDSFHWNEWITFPIKYQDLPLNSQIAITVWNIVGPRKRIPIGGCTLPLYGKNKFLRKGNQSLLLWRHREGDGSSFTSTPGNRICSNQITRIEKMIKKYGQGKVSKSEWLDKLAFAEIDKLKKDHRSECDELLLYLELRTFDYPVLFHEKEMNYNISTKSGNVLVTIYDPELGRKDDPNPIANKHLKLVTSSWRKVVDPQLRPSPKERDRIQKILLYPPNKKLDIEDKDIIWKFRFYLTSNKHALTKFLRCVDWTNSQEVKQATDLINQWEPIEISDALELLSKSFTSHTVRDYAVSRLEKASNEELLHYLLQLVQALRYDTVSTHEYQESKLASFLISRAIPDISMRNFLFWYLRVECEDPKYKDFYQAKLRQFLASFSDPIVVKLPNSNEIFQLFDCYQQIIASLSAIYKELRNFKTSRKNKIAKFSELMNGPYSHLSKFSDIPIPLPLDPTISITGIIPDKLKIFSSSMEPLGIRFRTASATSEEGEYQIIFKSGDDLRQDQIVIQLISLMDMLLKKENLDLHLKPYRVLATSTKEGMLECVPNSLSITNILKDYGNDIHNYLKENHSAPGAPYGIDPEVINTFVRSCAGYCVITFILCVGDRHLDNLLITTGGNLFHVDFGFIGRDPKPYPPPMKLCSEMVAAMGGENSKDFELFKQLCVEAYNILRKKANLILNLVSLMIDANIPDIGNERCVLQIQDKFQLDKTDEEAGEALQKLMQDSVTALFPRLSERIHKWKQYWDNR